MQDNKKETQSSKSSINSEEENIFIANPEPPKEQQKNTIAWEIIAAILFIIAIIITVVAWAFVSANNIANQYVSSTNKQLTQLEVPLKDLTPDTVINNKNLDATLEKITELQQPNLNTVFFASVVSPSYQQAEATKQNIQDYYKELTRYAQDITKLVSFSAEMKEIKTQVVSARANTQTNSSASLRSLSGTLTKLQQQIVVMETPPQLEKIQRQVSEAYAQEVEDYYNWAIAIETNQPEKIQKLETSITANTEKIQQLTTDENYTKQFDPSYKNLQKQQQALIRQLNT